MSSKAILLVALSCSSLAVGSGTAAAQYFGQNKVQYKDLEVLRMEHLEPSFLTAGPGATVEEPRRRLSAVEARS